MPAQPHTATQDSRETTEKEGRTHNTGLAKVAVQCSADTFVDYLQIKSYRERM